MSEDVNIAAVLMVAACLLWALHWLKAGTTVARPGTPKVDRGEVDLEKWHRSLPDDIREKMEDAEKVRMEMEIVTSQMCPATAEDWRRFLAKRTKPVTHHYNYNFPRDRFWIAYTEVTLPAACGANAISVIAAPGVKVRHAGGASHCSIYSMDDPDAPNWWVPSFNNARQEL